MQDDLLTLGVLGTMSWTPYQIEWALGLGTIKAYSWLRHFPLVGDHAVDQRTRLEIYKRLTESFHIAGLTSSLGHQLQKCSDIEERLEAAQAQATGDPTLELALSDEWMFQSDSLLHGIYKKILENHGSSVCALVILGHLWGMLSRLPDNGVEKEKTRQAVLDSHWKEIGRYCADLEVDTQRLSRILLQYSPKDMNNDTRLSLDFLNQLKKPISILILAADARDEKRLRLGEECRELDREIRTGRLKNSLVIHQAHSCRVHDVTEALDRYKPAILHFRGYGNASSIILEDDRGAGVEVNKNALAALLETQKGLGLVVLNASFSQDNAQVIADTVGYVIGMEGIIGDSAAISFSRELYRAIASGRSIEAAFVRAKSAASLTNNMRCHLVKGKSKNIPSDASRTDFKSNSTRLDHGDIRRIASSSSDGLSCPSEANSIRHTEQIEATVLGASTEG